MSMTKSKRKRVREELRERQKGLCCYCEHPMRDPAKDPWHPDAETIEHLRPKCEGGTHELGNLALACHRCNTKRRQGVDWLTYKSYRMGECDKHGNMKW